MNEDQNTPDSDPDPIPNAKPDSPQSLGGKARADLPKDKLSEIGSKGAQARWGRAPRATHESFLPLGDKKLPCAVLSDGTTVLSRNAVFLAFNRTQRGRPLQGRTRELSMPSFADALNLKPFIDAELGGELTTLPYLTKKGRLVHGYKAEVLPSLCEAYLKARDAGALTKNQEALAEVSASLMRIFAKIGVVAWIHEVTGYQYVRDPAALSSLVALYISEERRRWQKEFRDEFYYYLNRLYGRKTDNLNARPQFFAKFTNKYIYDPLEHGQVRKELDKVNPVLPSGHRKDKQHQHVSADYGILRVRERIEGVLTLLKLTDNRQLFDRMYSKVFPSDGGYQAEFWEDA